MPDATVAKQFKIVASISQTTDQKQPEITKSTRLKSGQCVNKSKKSINQHILHIVFIQNFK